MSASYSETHSKLAGRCFGVGTVFCLLAIVAASTLASCKKRTFQDSRSLSLDAGLTDAEEKEVDALRAVLPKSASPLFQESTPLTGVTIALPYMQILREGASDMPDQKKIEYGGTLTYDGGKTLPFTARLKGGGRLSGCFRPNLILDFKKDVVAGTLFQDADEMYLTSPCGRVSSAKETEDARKEALQPLPAELRDYAALEWFGYQVFESMLTAHLKTRLALTVLKDSTPGNERYADLEAPVFFIEKKARLAKRFGQTKEAVDEKDEPWVENNPKLHSFERIVPSELALFEWAQAFVSNWDYGLFGFGRAEHAHNRHTSYNALVLRINNDRLHLPVGFDFDSAGGSPLLHKWKAEKAAAFFPQEEGDVSNILRAMASSRRKLSEAAWNRALERTRDLPARLSQAVKSSSPILAPDSQAFLQYRIDAIARALALIGQVKLADGQDRISVYADPALKTFRCRIFRTSPLHVHSESGTSVKVGLIDRVSQGDNEVCVSSTGEVFLEGYMRKENALAQKDFPRPMLAGRVCENTAVVEKCLTETKDWGCWSQCAIPFGGE